MEIENLIEMSRTLEVGKWPLITPIETRKRIAQDMIDGNKIQAIKELRQSCDVHGIRFDLKEAKGWIEGHTMQFYKDALLDENHQDAVELSDAQLIEVLRRRIATLTASLTDANQNYAIVKRAQERSDNARIALDRQVKLLQDGLNRTSRKLNNERIENRKMRTVINGWIDFFNGTLIAMLPRASLADLFTRLLQNDPSMPVFQRYDEPESSWREDWEDEWNH